MANENKNSIIIDGKDLFLIAVGKWYFLLCLLIVSICASLFYSVAVKTPLYDSVGEMYIQNRNSEKISSNEIAISTILTSDYEYMICDRAILDEVAVRLDNKYSYSFLKSAISVNNPENTRIIEVKARTGDPAVSKEIVDAVLEVSQEKFVELLSTDRVTIISNGNLPKGPSVPNTKRNVLKSIIVAFALYIALVIFLYFFDDKIKEEKDIEKYLNITVLGRIPYNQKSNQRSK